ncbi:25043_t:CDS:2 [Gigaspora margarita]|uniref:25043_t:CDS:1 n=1 Tax=Gigaspora margarita TaxID=4874 RepID=A0ABN7VXD9_GIGMA|nr:25043_t:CDS:2 [Gigaspora margarita]
MKLSAHREVTDYIISPEWEPTGEELARNAVLVSYENEISPEDDEKMDKQYPGDEVQMASTEQNYRMVIDTGSMMMIIPYFVRQHLYSPKDGWQNSSFHPNGYGGTVRVTQASREWLICLGDGSNWSNWVRTREVYSWQKSPLMSTVV